jgi:hypothetical protein
MSASLTVVEMLVLPTRDTVRFVTMGGGIIEVPIQDVTLVGIKGTKITMLTKPLSNKTYRIIIDVN